MSGQVCTFLCLLFWSELKTKCLCILSFTFCTCATNVIFLSFVPHFQNNLRYKLGPLVQYLAIFLCYINLHSCCKMASVLSVTVISFVNKIWKHCFGNCLFSLCSRNSSCSKGRKLKMKFDIWLSWLNMSMVLQKSFTIYKQVFIDIHAF